jgi:L-asparagine transporter-like permease
VQHIEHNEVFNSSLSNLNAGGGFFATGIGGFFKVIQLTFLAYAGVEIVAVASVETKNPKVALPKAINAIPIRVGLFYVGAIFIMLVLQPWDKIDPDASPFVTIFADFGIPFAASVINLVLISAALSGANSGLYSNSRTLFNLVKDKNAPAKLGELNKKKVPLNSLLLSAAVIIPAIIGLSFHESPMDAFVLVSSWCSVMYLCVWLMLLIAYIHYRKSKTKSLYKAPFGKLSVTLAIIVFSGMLIAMIFNSLGRTALLLGFVSIVILVLLYELKERRAKKNL